MRKEIACLYCGSPKVKTLGFSDFGSNNIEIEEIECLQCRMRTKIPLQNRVKQLRDNIENLSEEVAT